METYTLTKTAKGKNNLYTVTDEAGNVISTRTSARDYVACTISGEYYFGRIDLIEKGGHGASVKFCQGKANNQEISEEKREIYRKHLQKLLSIAYLK